MIKLSVTYTPYRRYEETGKQKGMVEAPTLRAALLGILNQIGMYDNGADVIEQEEEQGKQFTEEEIIEQFIESSNGDGCDYVTEIKNEDTGEVIFSTDEDDGNDWCVTVNEFGMEE